MTFKTECHNLGYMEVDFIQSSSDAENMILRRREDDTVTCVEFFEKFSSAEEFAITLLEKGRDNTRFLVVIRDDNNSIVWTHIQYIITDAMREIPAWYEKVVKAGKAKKPSTWLNFHGYGNYISISELPLDDQSTVLHKCQSIYEKHMKQLE